ncbi:MAG TPA: hypothetical protein VLM75_00570 [Spirochaetota bacterium]|nr:hypothetical protein [Spirochaetota bacterium]
MEDQGLNMGNNGKGGTIRLAGKVVLVALIFAVVFYLIYFTSQYGKANFVLSSQEITSGDEAQVTRYRGKDKVYFFLNRKFENLDSNMFAIEIEYFENTDFRRYKQINYEIDKDFQALGAYIPTEYFRRPGKYRIKASLDGKVVAANVIEYAEK